MLSVLDVMYLRIFDERVLPRATVMVATRASLPRYPAGTPHCTEYVVLRNLGQATSQITLNTVIP